jgi:hypothetical protein
MLFDLSLKMDFGNPNIWSLSLEDLYKLIDVWHVIGEEKYECFIEKISMKNRSVGTFIW